MLKSLCLSRINYRLVPIHLGIIATFALIPVWYRLRGAPPSFHALYGTGFLIFWPMVWAVVWWFVMRFPGLRTLFQDRGHRWRTLALMILIVWSWLSYSWAFTSRTMLPSRSEITISAAIPLTLAALFTVVIASAGIPVRSIILILVVSLIWNSIIVFLQVSCQGSIGLEWLGEFNLDPARSGVAIVQADGVRWLRPYGLLPHPNILAGFLVISLLATLTWILSDRPGKRYSGMVIFLAGLWSLLLTFSRGAWIGFAAGAIVFAAITWRIDKKRLPPLIAATGLALMVAGVFAVIYRPFLAARAGIGGESVELRSASDRTVYNEMALRSIGESPVLGVGIGNFPWVAAYYLVNTDFDLRGQQVHNIYLAAWAELGIVGLGLVSVFVVTSLRAGFRAALSPENGVEEQLARAGLVSGVAALLVIGLVDHYPWTLLQFQVAWWGLTAASIRTNSGPALAQ